MYRLNKIGTLKPQAPSAHENSRLGIGFEKLDRAVFDPEKAYDKLAGIGVKWVRIQSGWQRTEREKGVYDFAWLDSIVDNLIARGMRPWICLCYGNALYDELAATVFGAVGCPPVHTEEQRLAWQNYCVAIAEHFRGRVNDYEVWNEPDGKWCWKTGVNAKELGEFTIATANAVRAGNPDAYIIGGAVCRRVCGFLAQAFETTDMANAVDAISFHEYVYDESLVNEKVRAIRGLANLHNPKLEVIQGESGTQSRAGGHGALRIGAWTPDKQARLLLRHLTADLLADVKFTSYFTCVDMIEALNGTVGDLSSYLDYGYFGVLGADFDENGISTGDYTPKPSYYALQSLNAILGGNLTTLDLPVNIVKETAPHTGHAPALASPEITYGGFRLDNGAYAVAYWYPTNLMTTIYEGAITLHTAIPGELHLVDPMDGSVYTLPESMLIDDEYGHFILSHLPIKDYPMFLIFGKLPELEA
jgi:hypothetical protein